MNMLIRTIRDYIDIRRLIDREDRLLVGVSGGPDSVFLLEFLRLLQREFALHLFIAHVNHGLRGKESDADEAFVRSIASRLGLPLFCCRVNTSGVAREKKISLEDAGRMLRYNFFLNICSIHNIDKIVLAHTKDDQCETVVMRLLRGTGITGLAGMRPVSVFEGRPVIRPLL
ncbi:MAG: tRNA lysidine(34) synthetase TilS, partial [Candidatus Omnitrophica bacterium]|nr:tRNA lysidine(34) synthetase TilS [Candidatus Omnitrophota bacterium]